MEIRRPPNLLTMYSGRVRTLLTMNTGRKTKPSSCSRISAWATSEYSLLNVPVCSHVELEGADGEPGRGPGARQPYEVLAADVAGEEGGPNLGRG